MWEKLCKCYFFSTFHSEINPGKWGKVPDCGLLRPGYVLCSARIRFHCGRSPALEWNTEETYLPATRSPAAGEFHPNLVLILFILFLFLFLFFETKQKCTQKKGIVQDHRQRYAHPSPAERSSRRRRTAAAAAATVAEAAPSSNRDYHHRRHKSGGSGGGRGSRRSRKPLPTSPTPEEEKGQQQQRRRRRQQGSRRGGEPSDVPAASGEEQDRAPLAIPPLPKVLFRPPADASGFHQQRHRSPEATDATAGLDAAAVPRGGSGEGRGYFGSRGLSLGRWSSYAGTPTSVSFSPSSAVANPFIATRWVFSGVHPSAGRAPRAAPPRRGGAGITV